VIGNGAMADLNIFIVLLNVSIDTKEWVDIEGQSGASLLNRVQS
jgi:hypothetical protein